MDENSAPAGAGLRLTEAQSADLFSRAAAVFGSAFVERNAALGLNIVEAERSGATVTGADGASYIDCISGAGIYNLGRRPAQVLDAVREAVEVADQGNFVLVSEQKARLAQRLADFVPGDLPGVTFSVGRGEAFDFACKLARGATRRTGLVAPQGSWFGDTGFALSLSDRPDADEFAPLIPAVRMIPWNNLQAADAAIDEGTAAFCLEPVQAETGARSVDREYLVALRALCSDRGALLVLDETQTGMGRTGTRFAYGRWGVVPDILVIGEALGAGAFPICATMYRRELIAFLDAHPLIHLSTFGGADAGCLVARAALDVYDRERPWQNAQAMGAVLHSGLVELAAAHPTVVLGIDGVGLLLALRLGTSEQAQAFCRELAAAGVLALPGRVSTDTVALRPSLLVERVHADTIIEACSTAAAAIESAAKSRRPRRKRTTTESS